MNTESENEKFGLRTNKIVITELKSDSGVGNSSDDTSR